LSAPVAGRALRIEAHVGDEVIADETVVAEIEPIDPAFLDVRSEAEAQARIRAAEAARTLAKAEVTRAEAELDFARAELDRARTLLKREWISQSNLDAAQRAYRTRAAEVETASAALEMREHELEQARVLLLSPVEARKTAGPCDCIPVRAPVSGRVLRLLHESEGVVQPGDPLVEIGNPRDLEIVADLLSADAVKVVAGQRVIIEDWGGSENLSGRINRVEPFGFTKVSALGIEEQRVNVIIDFTDPPELWQRLGHGYRVVTRIVLSEGETLKVPLSALFRYDTASGWAVFVAEADGRARQRKVEIGRRTGFEAEIIEGVDEGDRIIIHPSDKITDGTRVAQRP